MAETGENDNRMNRSDHIDGNHLQQALFVNVGDVALKNPLIAASGTFGFGREMSELYDLSVLGGISTKGITPEMRLGNRPHRIAECGEGMLNAVGLQNPGLKGFLENELPFLESLNTAVIVNIAGRTDDDYVMIATALEETAVGVIEVNLSCPNIAEGGLSFGADPAAVERVTKKVRKVSTKPIWVKLTPNVTSIGDAAAAAEAGGADAVTAINTFVGMEVDLLNRRPLIRNNTGGYSGPAIRPLALRMVFECFSRVTIPVVGCGGIMCADDVLKFLLAGASAVQVGTANLIDPYAMPKMIDALPSALARIGAKSCRELIGQLKPW
jgi:dihydroorotate dehydrogenase (NAD+) catalytic subunit